MGGPRLARRPGQGGRHQPGQRRGNRRSHLRGLPRLVGRGDRPDLVQREPRRRHGHAGRCGRRGPDRDVAARDRGVHRPQQRHDRRHGPGDGAAAGHAGRTGGAAGRRPDRGRRRSRGALLPRRRPVGVGPHRVHRGARPAGVAVTAAPTGPNPEAALPSASYDPATKVAEHMSATLAEPRRSSRRSASTAAPTCWCASPR